MLNLFCMAKRNHKNLVSQSLFWHPTAKNLVSGYKKNLATLHPSNNSEVRVHLDEVIQADFACRYHFVVIILVEQTVKPLLLCFFST